MPLSNFNGDVFLKLELKDGQGKALADNFYWLSSKKDQYAWDKTFWAFTPMKSYANFKPLSTLSVADIDLTYELERAGNDGNDTLSVTLENKSGKIAFFIRMALKDGDGNMLYPVFWQDNYVSLLPGEKREITAKIPASVLSNKKATLGISGWNVAGKSLDFE